MLKLVCPNGHSAEFEAIKMKVSLSDTSRVVLEAEADEPGVERPDQVMEIEGGRDLTIVYRCRTCQVVFEEQFGVFVYGQG